MVVGLGFAELLTCAAGFVLSSVFRMIRISEIVWDV